LNSHYQEATPGHLVEIRKQSDLEEVEEYGPEPKDRIRTVSKFSEGLGFTEAGIKVFEDREQRAAAAARQGTMTMLVCYEKVLKEEKKRSLSRQTSVLDFFKSSSGIRSSTPVLLDSGDDDPNDRPTVQEEVTPP
jgi:hypothetical protein